MCADGVDALLLRVCSGDEVVLFVSGLHLTLCRVFAVGGGWSIKPIERLVPVSSTCCHASTPGLSTWWSSTVLRESWSRGGLPA